MMGSVPLVSLEAKHIAQGLNISLAAAERLPLHIGIAYEDEDGLTRACGGCVYDPDRDRWVAFAASHGEFEKHPVTAYRASLLVLKAAEEAQIDEIWAELDETIPRAAQFMKRLGFKPCRNEPGWWVKSWV